MGRFEFEFEFDGLLDGLLDGDLDGFEFEFDPLELELGLDRDLGLPLSGAPGGDDGVLDPMSLPGAADLDGARRVRFEFDGLLDRTRRVRFEFEFEFGLGFRVFHSLLCSMIILC